MHGETGPGTFQQPQCVVLGHPCEVVDLDAVARLGQSSTEHLLGRVDSARRAEGGPPLGGEPGGTDREDPAGIVGVAGLSLPGSE